MTEPPVTDADILSRMVRAFQVAMTDERIPADQVERVVNRVVYGDPCGSACRKEIRDDVTVHIHITTPDTGRAAVDEMRRAVLDHARRAPQTALRLR